MRKLFNDRCTAILMQAEILPDNWITSVHVGPVDIDYYDLQVKTLKLAPPELMMKSG